MIRLMNLSLLPALHKNALQDRCTAIPKYCNKDTGSLLIYYTSVTL
jgi:hypothetical protein